MNILRSERGDMTLEQLREAYLSAKRALFDLYYDNLNEPFAGKEAQHHQLPPEGLT